MKIYLAGTSVSNPPDEPLLQKLFKRGHKLHSYYHIPVLEKRWFEMNTKNKVELFLDSGAFSAWTQKTAIDIQEYIRFIKENADSIHIYANLDVIGLGGKMPGEATAAATLENQEIMERAGLSPIPAFHFGEPLEYLAYYVDNYDYIALGVAGVKGVNLTPWLDVCFSKYICDKDGMPKVKVHGFAVTSLPIMLKYPWYSVDSTSWVVTSRMGGIFIPKHRAGKPIYDEQPWKVMVSSRSPGIKDKGKHIDSVSKLERETYLRYIRDKGFFLGKSAFIYLKSDAELKENERWAEPKVNGSKRLAEVIIEEGLCNTYQRRDELNIMYFLDLEKTRPAWPWPFKMNRIQSGFGFENAE